MALRRLLALAGVPLLGVALTLALTLAPPTAAGAAAPTTVDASSLSAYLVGQLYAGEVYDAFPPPSAQYAGDVGLTIDGALALAAAGAHDATLARMSDLVAADADAYGSISQSTYLDGGAIGKTALEQEVVGRDPRAVDGHDLIALLDANVCTAAQVAASQADHDGECMATGAFKGAASVFSQALGVLAQVRAHDTSPGSARAEATLLSLQCPDGGWPSTLPAPTGAACDAAAVAEADSTALAVQALSPVSGPAAEAAVTAGLAQLAARQESDGGFPGAAGDNTSSAALAVEAMGLDPAAYAAPIRRAQAFLAARQNPDGGLQIDHLGGASDVRASTQGLSGAVGTPLSTLSHPLPDAGVPAAATGAADRAAAALVTAAFPGERFTGDHLELLRRGGPAADVGGTVTLALGLAATGTQDMTLAHVVAYLARATPSYTEAREGPDGAALAAMALLAEATGQNPHAFGGDLLGTLQRTLCTRASTDGRCTARGDVVAAGSGTGQALGVLVLARSSVTADHPGPASPIVTRLLQLQCPDGGFAGSLPPRSPCTSDVGTTGYALQALSRVADDVDTSPSPVGDALVRGQDFVLAQQQGAGGFADSAATGLAVQALLAAPTPGAAPAAGTRSVVGPALTGALAFLRSRADADGSLGSSATAPAPDVLATAQGALALTLAPLATLHRVVTPVPLQPGPAPTPATHPAPAAPPAVAVLGISTTRPVGALPYTGFPAGDAVRWGVLLVAGGATLAAVGRRRPRRWVLLAVVAGTGLAVGGGRASAAPVGGCTTADVAVVVSFSAPSSGPGAAWHDWPGGAERVCVPWSGATTGLSLLHAAGFATIGTTHDGPAFVCGISPLGTSARYPTPAEDACVTTPPASAYWVYWHADPGATGWSYSQLGAASYHPVRGGVDAWTFGDGREAAPPFTPQAVLPTGSPTVPPSTAPTSTPARDASTVPSRPAASSAPAAVRTAHPSTAAAATARAAHSAPPSSPAAAGPTVTTDIPGPGGGPVTTLAARTLTRHKAAGSAAPTAAAVGIAAAVGVAGAGATAVRRRRMR